MKKTNTRLQLDRTTLRRLSDSNLERVNGGAFTTSWDTVCGPTYETYGCVTQTCPLNRR